MHRTTTVCLMFRLCLLYVILSFVSGNSYTRLNVLEWPRTQPFWQKQQRQSDFEVRDWSEEYSSEDRSGEYEKDFLEVIADKVIKVDEMIKRVCLRQKEPLERYTENHYRRTLNIKGYRFETVTVRIKHSVMHTTAKPEYKGSPALEDITILPEGVISRQATYTVHGDDLTIAIPLRHEDMGSRNRCGGDPDERVINVPRRSRRSETYKNRQVHIDVRSAPMEKNNPGSIVYPDN